MSVIAAVGLVLASAAATAAPQAGARGRATTGRQGATPAKPSPGAGPIIDIETTKGTIEMETYPNEAPKSVAHIVDLVRHNFYNAQRVHRVVPGQLVQFGDPLTKDLSKADYWGTGGSGRPIGVNETNPRRKHLVGTVALANEGGDPRTSDSQMYIMLIPQPKYDGHYIVIGRVLTGMDVVRKLVKGDIIRRVSVKAP
jgi:cyclophilin family peptidyl-prolyl cis-trans isomerase